MGGHGSETGRRRVLHELAPRERLHTSRGSVAQRPAVQADDFGCRLCTGPGFAPSVLKFARDAQPRGVAASTRVLPHHGEVVATTSIHARALLACLARVKTSGLPATFLIGAERKA